MKLVWLVLMLTHIACANTILLPHSIETAVTVSSTSPARLEFSHTAAHTWFCVAAAVDRGPHNAEATLFWSKEDPGNDYAVLAESSSTGPSVLVCGEANTSPSPPSVFLAVEASILDGINPNQDIPLLFRGWSGVGPRPLLPSALSLATRDGASTSGLGFGLSIPGSFVFAPASNEDQIAEYRVLYGPLFRTDLWPNGGAIDEDAAKALGTPGAPDLDLWRVANSAEELLPVAANFTSQTIPTRCTSASSPSACQYTVAVSLAARTANLVAVVAIPGPTATPGSAPFSMGSIITAVCTVTSAASSHGECRPLVVATPNSPDKDADTVSRAWIWFLVCVAIGIVLIISAFIARSLWQKRKARKAKARGDKESGSAKRSHDDLLGKSGGRKRVLADFDTAPDWMWKKTAYDRHMFAMGADVTDGSTPNIRVGSYEQADGKKAQSKAAKRAANNVSATSTDGSTTDGDATSTTDGDGSLSSSSLSSGSNSSNSSSSSSDDDRRQRRRRY